MAPHTAGLVSRALGVLLAPGRAWDRVAEAPAPAGSVMRGFVAPLAAIPAICSVAGALLFGFNIANVGLRMTPSGLILGALAGYAATLAAVWALAAFVDLVAPVFGGRRGRDEAMTLVALSATASWLGGLAEVYPSLGLPVGVLAGLWSLYVLFVGLPTMIRIPDEQRLPAFAAVLVAILLLGAARGMIVSRATELGGPLAASYAPR